MQIAVLSDSHDNIRNLEKALNLVGDAGQLVFLGDFCAPFSLAQIADAFPGPVDCVPGNNDGDMFLLMTVAFQAGNVTFHNPVGVLSTPTGEIAFTHYPEVGEGLAATGKYRAVFSGHTHRFMQKQVGQTLWLNPGDIMGRYGEPGFVLYNSDTGAVQRVLLG